MASIVPLPRRSLDSSDRVRRWYENELGWATVPGTPVRLITGLSFDALDVPAEAGFAALRQLGRPGSPVALHGERMRLLVAAGSASELSGLLAWLDWGTLELDLTVVGAGGHIEAPYPWPYGALGPAAHPGRPIEASLPGPGRGDHLAAVEAAPPCFRPGTHESSLPGRASTRAPFRPSPPGRSGSQGAAVWLRPPSRGARWNRRCRHCRH